MSNYQTEVQNLVDHFVAQLNDLWRRQAINSLTGGVGARGPDADRERVRRRGEKRKANELEQLARSFVTFVAKQPGLRIEQINKQLGTTTKQLQLPIRTLIAEGEIKTKGKKRSMTYFAK